MDESVSGQSLDQKSSAFEGKKAKFLVDIQTAAPYY
jgi:hypothetical protein